MQAKTAPTAKRRLRWVGLIVASVVLLEVALQAASFVAYLTYSRYEVTLGADGGATILCVGDSYTYGLGSSSRQNTYPEAMRTALSKQGAREPTVINAGWPGHNSRDLLARLDGQLEEHAPDLVFILVGINDTWSKPERLELTDESRAAAGTNWHWRWRTGRLFAWAFADAPVARAKEDSSPTSKPPAADPATPSPEAPDNRAPFDRGFARLGAGDAEGAVRAFEEALEQQPHLSPGIHQGLVQAYSTLGLADEAKTSLQWLETEHARDAKQSTTESLVNALITLRENARAFEVARTGVEAHPRSTQMWYVLAEEHYRTWELDRAEQAYDRALEHAPPRDNAWRAMVARACARTCFERDARKSLKLVINSLLLDGDLGKCLVALKPGRSRYSEELARECLTELALDPASEQAARRLIAILLTMTDRPIKDEAMCRVLESHLNQMIAVCDARGVRPILMTYPMPMPHVAAVVAEVCRRAGVEMVDLRRRFDETTPTRRQQELFIPHGHCSDGGYVLMGEAAANVAGRFLPR